MKSRAKRLLSTAVAAGLVFGLASVVGAEAASAATPKETSLVASGTVTTKDKVKWALTFVALNDSGPDSDLPDTVSIEVQIQRNIGSTDGGYESHEWNFTAPSSDLTFSASTGKGALNTGTDDNPLASIKLSFTSSSSKKESCSKGSGTTYPGSLSGALTLNTGLTNGGTIGSSSMKFTAKSPEFIVDSGCEPPVTDSCSSGTSFEAFGSTGSGLLGLDTSNSSKHLAISIVKEVPLAAPEGALRADQGGLLTGPEPVYSSSKKTLTVKSPSSGPLTGSGVFSGGKSSTQKSACTDGGKKYEETDQDHFNAKFTNSSLTAHTDLTGKLTVPSKFFLVGYEIDTLKAA